MKIYVPVSMSKTQYFINQKYVEYVKEAGLAPILVTPLNNIEDLADFCDGLLLPGGIDLNPTFYGEDNYASFKVDPEKDDFERRALYAFIERGKPVFGICRGFQLIVREFLLKHSNHPQADKMAFGQHVGGHSMVSDRDVDRHIPTHRVFYSKNALYGVQAVGNSEMFVNSIHHQALLSKGKANIINIDDNNRLAAVAVTNFSVPDRHNGAVVEAVDVLFEGCRLRAVQWHPEELKDTALIKHFFEQEEVQQQQA